MPPVRTQSPPTPLTHHRGAGRGRNKPGGQEGPARWFNDRFDCASESTLEVRMSRTSKQLRRRLHRPIFGHRVVQDAESVPCRLRTSWAGRSGRKADRGAIGSVGRGCRPVLVPARTSVRDRSVQVAIHQPTGVGIERCANERLSNPPICLTCLHRDTSLHPRRRRFA